MSIKRLHEVECQKVEGEGTYKVNVLAENPFKAGAYYQAKYPNANVINATQKPYANAVDISESKGAVVAKTGPVTVALKDGQYHRNGVSGRPYLVLEVDWIDEQNEATGINWLAILTTDNLEAGNPTSDVLLLNPANPHETMRGADYFGPAIIGAYYEADQQDSGRWHR